MAKNVENEQCGPVHKQGGKSVVKSYPPVSLPPALSKIPESMVVARITDHLERHHFLCSQQFGFRQGYLKVTVSGWESEVQPIEAGVPQGNCLGPLL